MAIGVQVGWPQYGGCGGYVGGLRRFWALAEWERFGMLNAPMITILHDVYFYICSYS